MAGPCFVVHYLVSSLAIISLGEKDSLLLDFNCLLMSFQRQLVFCVSSSLCCGLVYSV